MLEQADSTPTMEECVQLEQKFVERKERLSALFDLDRALSAAANRHDLAAQIVHYGWPTRAD